MKRPYVLAGLILVYFVAGKLGLSLALLNPSASVVWPAMGIALAAVLILGLVLAGEISKRKQVEERLHHLSLSDPLTGLANYRQLAHVMEREIARAKRTERAFTILFMDVDRLKSINDRFGHVTGSRALVRVADALRLCCRDMDTVARFGGDEFVVVLPETGSVGAHQLASRVAVSLRCDGQDPPVSFCAGAAEYPLDGTTVEELFNSADRFVYREKEMRAVITESIRSSQ